MGWDDDKNFLANFHYRGLGWHELQWMWSTFHLGHYVPLSWMSLGADYLVWGMNPAGYHATSLALHVANATMLYFIARRIFQAALDTPPTAAGEVGARSVATRAFPPEFAAAATALLFAVHPLRVESVAWVTERRDVLSGLFYLGAVLSWLRYCDGSARNRRWYAIALMSAVCAVLSKATAVTLPAVLAVLAFYPLRHTAWRDGWWSESRKALYRELAPFALISASIAALAFVALQHVEQLPVAGKFAVSGYSIAFYLLKTIVPSGLAPLYAMPLHVDPFAARYLASGAVVAAICVLAWISRRRAPGFAAAWLVFLLVALPLVGVHQNGPQIAADRYTYNATIALALLAASTLFLVPRQRAVPAVALTSLVIAALMVGTWRQTLIWRDSRSLWTQVLSVEPDSYIAHNNWATALMQSDQLDSAAAHYEAALTISPGYVEAEDNLGVVRARQGRFAEAIAHHQRALVLDSMWAGAHNNWGVALARQGMDSAAVAHFQKALRLNPEFADAHVNWGNALVRAGHPEEAIEQYREAVALKPDDADAHTNWGVALARLKRYEEAIEHFRLALVGNPDHAGARAYLERTSQLIRQPD